MINRIKGGPRQGVWFSADVRFLNITTDNSDWLADLLPDPDGVDSGLERIIEAVETRGTVIGIAVASDTLLTVMVDYGQAFNPDNVTLGNQTAQDIDAELVAAIDAIDAPENYASTTVVAFDGFLGVAQGTPA